MDDTNKIAMLTERLQALTKQIEQMTSVSRLEDLIARAEVLVAQVEGSFQPAPAAPAPEGKKQNEPSKGSLLPLNESIAALTDSSTTKMDGETKFHLLHRPTKDGEYSASKRDMNMYETMDESEWMADIEEAHNKQNEKNPIVSIWAEEGNIVAIPTGKANEGAWDGLGKNPYIKEFRIIIKPGKYQIHQEFKQ